MNFENNIIWAHVQTGVGFNSVMDTTFTGNFIGDIIGRKTLEAKGMSTLDVHGAALFCSLTFPATCPGFKITNNIVGGSIYAGFIAPAHNCDDTEQTVFRDNVAHAISGGFNGDGAVLYADPSVVAHK
jgi:hypothetical protein